MHFSMNQFYPKSHPLILANQEIEKKFQQFAEQIGISVDELDLLFWSNEAGEILK